MKTPPQIVIILLVLTLCSCNLGLYTNKFYNPGVYKCIYSTPYSKIIMKLQFDDPLVSKVMIINLNNAKSVGLDTQVYFRPCRIRSGIQQVYELLSKVKKQMYSKVWIGLERDAVIYDENEYYQNNREEYQDKQQNNMIQLNQQFKISQEQADPCTWQGGNPLSTCRYLQQIALQFLKNNISVGIASSKYTWKKIFKHPTACNETNIYPLWWLKDPQQQDSQPNFNDYIPFGGWSQPNTKLFWSNKTMCSGGFGFNYFK